MAKTFFPELTRVLCLLLTAAAAQADPFTWTVNNAQFVNTGFSLYGTFDYDFDTNLYSNVNLYSTNNYTQYTTVSSGDSSYLHSQSTSGVTGTLHLDFFGSLTNAGGVVVLFPFGISYETVEGTTRDIDINATVTGVPVVVPPVNVAISIHQPMFGSQGKQHPHHDGSASSPAGLNDVIKVRVLGSLISVGDPVDFTANEIAPATLRFGPDQAAIRPGSTPVFNEDMDFDGINDARFEFLTGDSGIACLDTAATLTGETNAGAPFEGVGSFTTDCDAQCH